MTDLESIETQCTELTAATEAAEAAQAEENAAAGDLLDRLAAKARPVVAVIGKAITLESAETSGRNGCNPVSKRVHGPKHIILIDDYERRGDGTGNRGDYGGHRLILTHEGFSLARRDGTWSDWQGEWNRYEVTLTALTGVEVAERYEIDAVVKAIIDAVAKAVEAKPDASRHRTRAERFRALAALL